MAAPTDTTQITAPRRLRLLGLRRAVAPIREARGFAQVIVYVGAAITLFFILLAIFAPLISPYDFDQYQSGGKRFPQLPNVPTVKESGVPDYEYESWFGVMAPAGVAKPIIAVMIGLR